MISSVRHGALLLWRLGSESNETLPPAVERPAAAVDGLRLIQSFDAHLTCLTQLSSSGPNPGMRQEAMSRAMMSANLGPWSASAASSGLPSRA